jgi:hypothetical protein
MYILKTRNKKRSDSRNFVVSQCNTHETAPPLSHVVLLIMFSTELGKISCQPAGILTLHNSYVPEDIHDLVKSDKTKKTVTNMWVLYQGSIL